MARRRGLAVFGRGVQVEGTGVVSTFGAISSGLAIRFRACIPSTKAMISGVWANSRPASVSVPPGSRQLLRSPFAPNSAAMTRDRPTRPASVSYTHLTLPTTERV